MNGDDLVETLRRFNLFADLDRAQLEAIADPDSERSFAAGERILRRGMSGSGFYVILDGEATVTLGDQQLNVLRSGDFFGEISTQKVVSYHRSSVANAEEQDESDRECHEDGARRALVP